MTDLTVYLLALPPGGGEALLLVHHIGHCDWLVPALLLPDRLAEGDREEPGVDLADHAETQEGEEES